ncbi:unnamed protein product [Pedinophyceae sp. YPF-701]|nr:unnamed protein product [Pedinophyceae sp. YPF-701]
MRLSGALAARRAGERACGGRCAGGNDPRCRARNAPQAAQTAQESHGRRASRHIARRALSSPVGGPSTEREEEALLRDSAAAEIYGIPRSEWLKLQAPARYLGNEFGAMHKDFDAAEVRCSLTYPEVYEVGASNLGHILLYTLLNRTEGVMCDRSYYPGDDLRDLLAKYDKPLFAVESRRPLSDFDVLGFSLSYELGGTNILEMLRQSNIPVSWEERAEPDDEPWDVAAGSRPLIFAGGPTATSNPEPFSDFLDFVALGDGEELLPEIATCLKQCKRERLSRSDTLLRLATTVAGVYVPQFYQKMQGWGGAVFPAREGVPARVERRVADPDPTAQVGLVPFVSTVHDRLTIEIRRGCTRGCRFCQPGMLTRPARDVEPSAVVDAVEEGMRKTGYNEFSLLSLSCSDYLSLPSVGLQIKNRLRDEPVSLSLPSQRVDAFDDNVADVLTAGNAKRSGLTFAPEAGTQRLRNIVNKTLTNEELLAGVKKAWDLGWFQVKLYFMIGLPGETDEDVLGIPDTIAWLQRECRRGSMHLAVNVTISCFTPKPHTPFQWHSVSTSEFKRKQNLLREAFKDFHQVKVNMTPPEISAMEDFIGRGDRSIGKVIRRAWEKGATNDAWWCNMDGAFQTWGEAIEEAGMDWKYRQVLDGEWDVMEKQGDERYRKQGGGGKGRIDRGELADKRLDMPLPWDHIDTGVSKYWLKTELQRALEAVTTPDCSHSDVCTECGVCEDDEPKEGEARGRGSNIVFPSPPIPKYLGPKNDRTVRTQRLRFKVAKRGDMVFVGHLDLMSAIERACRRAALPVSTDASPYNARPRISVALALSLGATTDADWLEIVFYKRLPVAEIRRRLQEQFPKDLHLLSAEEVPIYRLDGGFTDKMSDLMRSVEYYLLVRAIAPGTIDKAAKAAVAAEAVPVKRKTKRGKKKKIDLRQTLMDIAVVDDADNSPLGRHAPDILREAVDLAESAGGEAKVVRVRSKVLHNGYAPLTPDSTVEMLNLVSEGAGVELLHIHRSDIELGEQKRVKPNQQRLASIVRWEAFAAIGKARGQGPWAKGMENRPDDIDTRWKLA